MRGERPRFLLVRDRLVSGAVTKATGPSPGVGTEVLHEEAWRSQLAPLTHVDELVREEHVIVLVTSSDEDPAPQCHAGDSWRQERHDDDPRSLGVTRRDVIECCQLARVQTSRHGVSR